MNRASETRATPGRARSISPRPAVAKGWTNKLIWGDNKLILSSLKAGALRQQIEDAGGLKLIYIDIIRVVCSMPFRLTQMTETMLFGW